MNGDEDLDLNEAYAVETPDDNRDLYGRWATTYESGFATRHAYVYHERVAATFTESVGPDDDPVLDIGCGTGLVGLELRGLAENIDGLDLSARAAAAARGRRHWDDSLPLYGTVAVGDFLRGAPPVDAKYDLVVAADVAPFYGPLDDVVRGLAALVEPEGDLVLSLDTAEDGSTKGVGYVARPGNRYAQCWNQSRSRRPAWDIFKPLYLAQIELVFHDS